MVGRITRVLSILAAFFIILILAGIVLYYNKVGFTKKQQYQNCLETCYQLVFSESTKQYCSLRCQEVSNYLPSSQEEKEIISNLEESESDSEPESSLKNTSTSPALNKITNYQDREYYCQWVWPQNIIDKNTKERIVNCSNSYPWCNYADFSFENVGCCRDKDYTDCQSLPSLVGE